MITAMLFAGGSGVRMESSDLPKQFLEVGGKPIIIHTMEHFSKHPLVDAIVVACKSDWIGYLKDLIVRFNVQKVRAIVPGGRNGFDSIHNGVVATAEFSLSGDDLILICDGVRPMLSEKLITDCINHTRIHKTAVPVTPSIDSLLYSTDGETCGKSYARNTMFITQAPQGYTMERCGHTRRRTSAAFSTRSRRASCLSSWAKRCICFRESALISRSRRRRI